MANPGADPGRPKKGMHTVAVYLPGTTTRVLVDMVEGTPAQALEFAPRYVQHLASVAPALWRVKVISTLDLTDLGPPQDLQKDDRK